MLVELKNGRKKKFPDAVGKVLVKRGLGKVVDEQVPTASPQTYQTRDMQAAAPAAPYGLKADGTPRLRPAPQSRDKV